MFISPPVPARSGRAPASTSCAAGSPASRLGGPVDSPRSILFFHPGLHLGIDFRGGIVMEVRTPGPADFGKIRSALRGRACRRAGRAAVRRRQRCADPAADPRPSEQATQATVTRMRDALEQAAPGTRIVRTDAVGASVSAELFRDGMLALGHQPADDPGLYLVPLRVGVRGRRGRDPDPRHDQGDRLPRAHAASSSTWSWSRRS